MTHTGTHKSDRPNFPMSQYAYLVVTIVLVIPIVVLIALRPNLTSLYYEYVAGPAIQRAFGFTAEYSTVRSPQGEQQLLVITSVEPGGVLARAGVVAGDAPVGYQHGTVDFYRDLDAARQGNVVSLRLLSVDLPTRRIKSPQSVRRVEIAVRRE